MNVRRAGMALTAVGAIIALAGVVEMLGSGEAESPVTTVAMVATTSTTVESTTSVAPSTSTSLATTTSTAASSTTAPAVETVEDFIPVFAVALEAGDSEFVFARLHPVVVGIYGEDLCRGWVDREIMALEDYTLTGPVDGPKQLTITEGGADTELSDAFTAPIEFTFQGEQFDSEGQFGLIDGTMYWLGQCR